MKQRPPSNCDGFLCDECAPWGCAYPADEGRDDDVPDLSAIDDDKNDYHGLFQCIDFNNVPLSNLIER